MKRLAKNIELIIQENDEDNDFFKNKYLSD